MVRDSRKLRIALRDHGSLLRGRGLQAEETHQAQREGTRNKDGRPGRVHQQRNRRKLRQRGGTRARGPKSTTTAQNENSTGIPASTVRLENDLLRMVYMIIVIFAVCYLPSQVDFLLFWFGVYTRYEKIITPYRLIIYHCVTLLKVLPGALHPVCYGTMSAFYARAFSRLRLCRSTQ